MLLCTAAFADLCASLYVPLLLSCSPPPKLTGDLKSLLVGLLDPNPETRFGAKGAARAEDQPYFRGIDFDNILAPQNHPSPGGESEFFSLLCGPGFA